MPSGTGHTSLRNAESGLSTALEELDVSNVYVYVGDAVREDAVEGELSGLEVRTVAASIHTATSFPSIVSGEYLPQHGVTDFTNQFDGEGLFDLPGVNTAFANTINRVFNENPELDNPLSNTLGVKESPPDALKSIEPPFLFVERGKGGHAPYGDFDGNGWEYFRDRKACDREQYRREYNEGVEVDLDWFASQVQVLSDRGIEDDTLVVYTSDHGELLGESGSLGHNAPIHPKLAYVPTYFLHPKLSSATIRSGVLRHVDMYPTITSLLDSDEVVPEVPYGRDLTAEPLAETGATFYRRSFFDEIGPLFSGDFRFEAIWSRNGGYVFPTVPRRDRLSVFLGKSLKSAKREYLRRNAVESLPFYLAETRSYGNPKFSRDEAIDQLAEIRTNNKATETGKIDVDEKKLRNLGYIS